jgi:hypothetical protein
MGKRFRLVATGIGATAIATLAVSGTAKVSTPTYRYTTGPVYNYLDRAAVITTADLCPAMTL